MKKRISIAAYGLVIGLFSFGCAHEKGAPDVVQPDAQNLRLEKITSGADNVHSYFYNERGSIVRYSSHWVFPNTTNDVNATVAYDSLHRVQKVVSNGSNVILFFYRNEMLDKTEEYDHRNRLAVTHFYTFSSDERLVKVLDKVHDQDSPEKDYFINNQYEYDPRGNVIFMRSYVSNERGEKYTGWLEVHYEDYDDKTNPDPGLVSYPFVEGKCVQQNNPGKITVTDMKTQSIISVQQNSFTYNAQGYPVKKVQQLTNPASQTKTSLDYHYSSIISQ